MKLKTSESTHLAYKALDFRALRQKLISSNIANVDTPYYRAKDIQFEDVLAHEANTLATKQHTLDLAKSHTMHLDPLSQNDDGNAQIFFRGAHPTRNDGNDVDIDIETTEMSKNGIMFEALINALKKNTAIYKSVIDASGKIQ